MDNIKEFPKNPCTVCRIKEATILCDYPETVGWACKINDGQKGSCRSIKTTCDKALCEDCAIKIALTMDFCPDHARQAVKDITDQLSKRRSN